MLPLAAHFPGEVVGAARRERELDAAEAPLGALAEGERRRGPERNPDDLVEHRAVAVPADARPGIIADHQRLDEVVAGKPREIGRAAAERLEPVGDRNSRRSIRPRSK